MEKLTNEALAVLIGGLLDASESRTLTDNEMDKLLEALNEQARRAAR